MESLFVNFDIIQCRVFSFFNELLSNPHMFDTCEILRRVVRLLVCNGFCIYSGMEFIELLKLDAMSQFFQLLCIDVAIVVRQIIVLWVKIRTGNSQCGLGGVVKRRGTIQTFWLVHDDILMLCVVKSRTVK